MSSTLKIVNPLFHFDWDNWILGAGEGNVFHSRAWAEVLYASYRYRPVYFTIFRNNALAAVVPCLEVNSKITGKRGVSLPFSDYTEPIVKKTKDFDQLLKGIQEYAEEVRWKHFELRGAAPYLDGVPVYENYSLYRIRLDRSEQEIIKKFRSSTRRNIQAAIKKKVRIEFSTSIQSIKQFYRLLCLTRKRQGLPPQPFRFFDNIHRLLLAEDRGFLVLAFLWNQPIAGALFLNFEKKGIYKFGASDRRYQEFRANNLVIWNALKWYREQGFEEFDFGRTEPGNQGLHQFKSGWGGEHHLLKYFRYDLRKKSFTTGNQQSLPFASLFRNTPLPCLKLCGEILYRHMG